MTVTAPELRQLRYFIAVAEELNFTKAAERLMIAQQSLSAQIAVLERRLGVRLLERDARGTRLSAVGVAFLPEARAVLERVDQAIAVALRASHGEVGSLRLAFLTTVANHMLPPVLRAIHNQLPDVQVATESTTIAAVVDGVLNGRYDAAFTRPPLVEGIASRALTNEQVCAVLPTGHSLADATELKLEDLAAEPWVHLPPSAWEPWHHAFTDQFAAAGFTPRVVAYDSNPQTLLALVAAGIGVTRLARPAQDLRGSGVVFVPLANQFTTTEIVWLPTNTNPALARLIDIVTTLAATTDLTTTG